MVDFNLIYILFFIIIFIQSIVGIGVLAIGTPVLLIFGFDFKQTLSLLLPISILTSFINLILITRINKKKYFIDFILMKDFFKICTPSIFIGIYLVKLFEESINFGIIVGLIILISLTIKLLYEKKFLYLTSKLKNISLIVIGIVHGLSNSGGSILLLIKGSSKKKQDARYYITYFYLLLALVQYTIFLYFFKMYPETKYISYIIILVLLGSGLSNLIIEKINDSVFKSFINFIIAISSLILLFKSLIYLN